MDCKIDIFLEKLIGKSIDLGRKWIGRSIDLNQKIDRFNVDQCNKWSYWRYVVHTISPVRFGASSRSIKSMTSTCEFQMPNVPRLVHSSHRTRMPIPYPHPSTRSVHPISAFSYCSPHSAKLTKLTQPNDDLHTLATLTGWWSPRRNNGRPPGKKIKEKK